MIHRYDMMSVARAFAALSMGLFLFSSPVLAEDDFNKIPFNAERSYGYLKAICDIGSRVSGTRGMTEQQKMLTDHFTRLGGKVSRQEFAARHPVTGTRVPMTNLIVQWHPEKKARILICCHYDTRPFPDEDYARPRGVFIGANDGASGAALLMELGEYMPELESIYGVDFVFFDGEELVFDKRRDPYFLGSEHFAREYVANPPGYRYVCGFLLDMVADADLQLYQEKNSLRYARSVVEDFWRLAGRLRVKEFIARPRHEVRDDHLALNEIAKIPTIDIIDFDYPSPTSRKQYWHTEQDIPANCSAESLGKVGKVLHEWLRRASPPKKKSR